MRANPGDDHFSELRVGYAEDVNIADLGMGVQELFDLGGEDVLAAANNQVFPAAVMRK